MPKGWELLAPAGDKETLNACIRFGADAVYIGGELFQLRAQKTAFDLESIRDAANLLHQNQKKLYVTVNAFLRTGELSAFASYAKELAKASVDAVIVSDLGALSVIKKAAPELKIHISTQANCCNSETARLYSALGADRVVLARELTLEEIAELRENTPPELELEAFVHGAMCMAYSGRCLLSSFLTGRSGNRGECTQPCRWRYHLIEQKRPNEFFEIEEENGVTAILSSHDLNCISILDRLIAAGITSFKIEGRMKTAYYAATVVNAYRRRLDGFSDLNALERELNSVSHRPFSTGFYLGELKKNNLNDGLYRSDCRFIGVVTEKTKNGIKVKQRNRFALGESLEIVSPYSFGEVLKVEALFNSRGEAIDEAKKVEEIVEIRTDSPAQVGDFLRRREEEASKPMISYT